MTRFGAVSAAALAHCLAAEHSQPCRFVRGQRERKKLHMFSLILNIGWFRTEVELHTAGAGGVKRAFVD